MGIIKLNILILFFLVENIAFTSDKVYDRTENNSFIVEFTSAQPGEHSINNFFIKEIAKYNLSGLYNTSFTFHYSIHNSISETSANTFTVNTELIGEKCTGDVYYKNIDISDIFMPEKADFRIVVIDENNEVESLNFKEITIDDKDMFMAEFTFEALENNKEYIIKLENINFYSNSNDKETFYKRINQIDNYYASVALMENALDGFAEIDLEAGSIIETYLKIKELERVYNKVSSAEFSEVLNLQNNDNAGYYEKLTKLDKDIKRYKSYYYILFNSINYLKLNENLAKCAREYVDEVVKYFVLSQEVTYSHSSYYYNMGKVDYNLSTINQYQKGINQILLKTPYCNHTREILTNLKNEIFNAYINKAREFIKNEQYYIAKGILINLQSFYGASVNKSFPVELNILISQVNYGIYDSYLRVIDRAIEIGSYVLAENYIHEAESFQKENSTSIISDKYIKQISEKLANLYISKGSQLNEEEEYKEALYCYEQAQTICNNLDEFNYDYEIEHGKIQAQNGLYNKLVLLAGKNLDLKNISIVKRYMHEASALLEANSTQINPSDEAIEMLSMINYYLYKNLIFEGQELLTSGNYNQACEKFLHAIELEDSSGLEKNVALIELLKQAAAPILVDLCESGEIKVKKNKLDEAKEIYNSCFELQNKYNLFFEASVQGSLTLLNSSIYNKYCENANQEFDEIINRVNKSIKTGDFISAIDILVQTDEIIHQNQYCDFDKSLVCRLKEKYRPAAEYQRLAISAHEALLSNNHQKVIKIYHKLEELSDNHEVIRKQIEPMPLHYLFSIKKNLALLENSIDYYKSGEEFETAFKLLRVLEANNISNKDTKSIQQKLATKMALADRENAQSIDPEVNVKKYTHGHSWFKYFRKAYIKNW